MSARRWRAPQRGRKAPMKYRTHIGIDAHARKNEVCAPVADTGEVRAATLPAEPGQIAKWIEDNGLPEPLKCAYESGPTGFGLARELGAAGIPCCVAAVSKLPKRVDRQRTDRLDAEWLARMLAAGSVREVRVPTEERESLCHLSRLRDELAGDLRRAKQRVCSFLLLVGVRYEAGRKRWTKKFRERARAVELPHATDTFVLRRKMAEVDRLEATLAEAEAEMERLASADADLSALVARLRQTHGVGRVCAMALACEVYDSGRFRSGAAFAAYVGLVPSEHSTGSRVSRGGTSKTGSAHVRRVLVEAAGCCSRPMRDARPEDPSAPAPVRAKAEKCRRRLRKRRLALERRGVAANKAKTAVARELAEWVYYVATMEA